MKPVRLLPPLLAAAAICAAPAPDPVHWEVREAPTKAVKPGTRLGITLVAHIDEGWHLYSMKRVAEGPIPTRIWIAPGQAAEITGTIKAPDPLTMQDPNFNLEVEFFTGEAAFRLPLRVRPAPAGAQKVTISTSYQACSDRICLPPHTIPVEVLIDLKK